MRQKKTMDKIDWRKRREEFGSKKVECCNISKWFVDWNVIMSLFCVIFAHSTVSRQRCCCCCSLFIHQLSLTNVYNVFSWNHHRSYFNKSLVKIEPWYVRSAVSCGKIATTKKQTEAKTKQKMFCQKRSCLCTFCVTQDYQWIPYCRICLTLLLPFPFFMHKQHAPRLKFICF